jgi:hypothetical protein
MVTDRRQDQASAAYPAGIACHAGTRYGFLDWVIKAGTDISFLDDKAATQFGITYRSMR